MKAQRESYTYGDDELLQTEDPDPMTEDTAEGLAALDPRLRENAPSGITIASGDTAPRTGLYQSLSGEEEVWVQQGDTVPSMDYPGQLWQLVQEEGLPEDTDSIETF